MSTPVLSSTFLLTLLLLVGLVFFIRASVKDRTQVARFISEVPEESLLRQLQQYFLQRTYVLTNSGSAPNQFAFEGIVRPSVFLAVFLTSLAAIAMLCIALVLSILLPSLANVFLGLILAAPLAGVFYWRKAKRPETVLLKVEPASDNTTSGQRVITVTAHRDEISELQRALALVSAE
mgnify:CR=1 FL=1